MTVAMVRVNLTNDPQASFMFSENFERLLDPKYEADQALGNTRRVGKGVRINANQGAQLDISWRSCQSEEHSAFGNGGRFVEFQLDDLDGVTRKTISFTDVGQLNNDKSQHFLCLARTDSPTEVLVTAARRTADEKFAEIARDHQAIDTEPTALTLSVPAAADPSGNPQEHNYRFNITCKQPGPITIQILEVQHCVTAPAWAATPGHTVLTKLNGPASPTQIMNLDLSSDFVESIMGHIDRTLTSKTVDDIRTLGYSLLGNPMTEEVGLLVLGKAAAWRKIWPFAAESFLRCNIASLAKYASDSAIRAFTETQNDAAFDLLAELGSEDFSYERYTDSALFEIASYAAFYGDAAAFTGVQDEFEQRRDVTVDLRQQWDNLVREFASQSALGADLATSAAYRDIHNAAVWKGRAETEAVETDKITLGFLNYRNPTRASSNIGDHVQTIAALGQLRSFNFTNLDADPAVKMILDRNPADEQLTVERRVKIMPIDRDFSVLQGGGPSVWLPVCGWFAHPVYRLNLGLPFASNINPIFMSFHINTFAVLTPETLEYLKAHEPIGCRDYLTVRTLREADISAFFNGCVTLTLGDLYENPRDGERHGRLYGAYTDQDTPDGYEAVEHLDRAMWTKDFNENIEVADQLLQGYQYAEKVTTPLLHCLLPCRSMGTNVEFTNPQEGDPRFQGLVDATDEMRELTAERFRSKYKAVTTAILEGRSRDEVYAVWKEVSAPDIERTDQLLAAEEVSSPLTTPFDMPSVVAQIAQSQYDIGFFDGEPANVVDLLFAFDNGYLDHLLAVLHSILDHTERPIRAHLFVRGVDRQRLEQAVAQFKGLECRVYDLSAVEYGDLDLMKHISVSTMDRLMAPEILIKVTRVIYLDIDILIRRDIGEMFDLEFDFPIAGRSGIDKRWSEGRLFAYKIPKTMSAAGAREFRSRLFASGPTNFKNFNAGVLWMNLESLRAAGMSNEAIGWATRFGLNDQYALNLFTRGQRGELPPEWNHFAIQEFDDNPALVHFIGVTKPWSAGVVLPFIDEWKTHADAVHGWEEG